MSRLLDVLNLVVGILAITLSLLSIAISIIFSLRATSTLDKVSEQAGTIEKDVRERMNKLIERAAPSEQERALSSVLPDLFRAAFADPEILRLIIQEGLKRQGRTNNE